MHALKITLNSQISLSEVDQPGMEKFRVEDLHDYPPRIICRFFPEENAPKRTTCTISLSGLLPQVEFNVPLKAPTPTKVAVDTTKLQVFTFVQCSLLKWCSGYLWQTKFCPLDRFVLFVDSTSRYMYCYKLMHTQFLCTMYIVVKCHSNLFRRPLMSWEGLPWQWVTHNLALLWRV